MNNIFDKEYKIYTDKAQSTVKKLDDMVYTLYALDNMIDEDEVSDQMGGGGKGLQEINWKYG